MANFFLPFGFPRGYRHAQTIHASLSSYSSYSSYPPPPSPCPPSQKIKYPYLYRPVGWFFITPTSSSSLFFVFLAAQCLFAGNRYLDRSLPLQSFRSSDSSSSPPSPFALRLQPSPPFAALRHSTILCVLKPPPPASLAIALFQSLRRCPD